MKRRNQKRWRKVNYIWKTTALERSQEIIKISHSTADCVGFPLFISTNTIWLLSNTRHELKTKSRRPHTHLSRAEVRVCSTLLTSWTKPLSGSPRNGGASTLPSTLRLRTPQITQSHRGKMSSDAMQSMNALKFHSPKHIGTMIVIFHLMTLHDWYISNEKYGKISPVASAPRFSHARQRECLAWSLPSSLSFIPICQLSRRCLC